MPESRVKLVVVRCVALENFGSGPLRRPRRPADSVTALSPPAAVDLSRRTVPLREYTVSLSLLIATSRGHRGGWGNSLYQLQNDFRLTP